MPSNQIFVSLLLNFHIVALIILWYFIWREYQKDNYRQRIFAIRDEMFDYIAEQNLGFDYPIFLQLRTTLNGSIRFSDRLDLWNISLLLILGKRIGFNRDSGKLYREKLESIFGKIDDPSVRKKFREFHSAYTRALVGLVVGSSIFLMVLFALSLIVASSYLFIRQGILAFGTVLAKLQDRAVESAPGNLSYALEAYSYDCGSLGDM